MEVTWTCLTWTSALRSATLPSWPSSTSPTSRPVSSSQQQIRPSVRTAGQDEKVLAAEGKR